METESKSNMNHDAFPQNPNQPTPTITHDLGVHVVAAANQHTASMSETTARESVIGRIIRDTESGSVTVESGKLDMLSPTERQTIHDTIQARRADIPEGRRSVKPIADSETKVKPGLIQFGERHGKSLGALYTPVTYNNANKKRLLNGVEVVRFAPARDDQGSANGVEVRYLFTTRDRPYTDTEGIQTVLGVSFIISEAGATSLQAALRTDPTIIDDVIKAQAASIGISPRRWDQAGISPSALDASGAKREETSEISLKIYGHHPTKLSRTKRDSLMTLAQHLEAEQQDQVQSSAELPAVDPRPYIEEGFKDDKITEPLDKLSALSKIMRTRAELGEDPHPAHHALAAEYAENYLEGDSDWQKLGSNADKIQFLNELLQDIAAMRKEMEQNGEDTWMQHTLQVGYGGLRDAIAAQGQHTNETS